MIQRHYTTAPPDRRTGRRSMLRRAGGSALAAGLAGSFDIAAPHRAIAAPAAGGTLPAVAGTYRLHSPEGERVLDLRLDPHGAASLTDPSPLEPGRLPFGATGAWRPLPGAGDVARVSLMAQRGVALARSAVFTVTFVAGFPTEIRSEAAGATTPPLDAEGLGFTLGSGDTHPLVRALHTHLSALARTGDVPFLTVPPPVPVFDEATRQAVAAFQASRRLVPDGAVDGTTWRALTNDAALVNVSLSGLSLHPAPAGAVTAQGQNVVYLTFDDGPNPPYTQQVLETLARYGAQATFFTVGQQVQGHGDLVRAEASAGHYVANHTFDHHTLDGLSRERFVDEAQRTRSLILDAAGDLFGLDRDVRYLRPPYGATDTNTKEFAASLGYALVLWDVDPQDWRRPGAAQISSHVLSHVHPGAVVLMHDGGGPRDQSVAALDTILRELTARGYVSRTIFSKFAGAQGAPGAPGASGAPGTPPPSATNPGAPASAPTSGPGFRVANTGGRGVNVHAEAGAGAPVLIALPEGTPLADLGGRQDAGGLSWVQVRTPQGVSGWASSQYVTPA